MVLSRDLIIIIIVGQERFLGFFVAVITRQILTFSSRYQLWNISLTVDWNASAMPTENGNAVDYV